MTNTELKQVISLVGVETFNKIEQLRGRSSRSSFIANILEDVLADFPAIGEKA
jgi:metal-responsive CopG/Arc/MetJ family transcriptional regulator